MELKPYPEYKDSGVSWLGEIPIGWGFEKFRSILFPIAIRNRPDLPLLSVVREKGVILRNIHDDSENHNVIPEDLKNYKVVNIGQFAMNKMKAWQGSYGISKYNGIVSPAYFVFNVKKIEAEYFHKAVRSKAYIPFFTAASDGIRVGQWDLSLSRLKEIPFYIPPVNEQAQIARFLDWKTSQIAKFIRKKKRLIELLKEQKQVIINDAVTGKIDVTTGKPYLKYKDSGVDWLGQVPETWTVIPLKHIVESNITTLSNRTDPDYKFRYIEINMIKAGYLIKEPERLVFEKAPSRARRKIKNGDTIISTVRTYLRAVMYIDFLDSSDIVVSTGFSVLTPKKTIDNESIGYYLRSDQFIDQVILNSNGVSYPAIADSKLLRLKVIVTNTTQQKQITKYIKNNSINIDQAISRTEREISLIQEYRDRLIADAVTGKIDVRDTEVPEFDEEVIVDEATLEKSEDEISEINDMEKES